MEIVLPDRLPSASSFSAELIEIETEKFDFNLSVSPRASQRCRENRTQETESLISLSDQAAVQEDDDDDEVYLGPVSYKEQCAATRVNLVENPLESGLTAEQYVELFQEANALAVELGEEEGKVETGDPKPETIDHLAVLKVRTETENKLDLSVELNVIAARSDGETEATEGASVNHGDDCSSVIERYKRLTKKNVRSPRRGTYVVDKKQVQAAAAGIAPNKPSDGPTRPKRLKRPSGGLQKRSSGRIEKVKVPEKNKLSLMKPPQLSSLPNPRGTLVDPAGLRTNLVDPMRPADEASRDLNSSSSSSGSNCSTSSIPCLRKPNPSQRQKFRGLKPPKAKQELPPPKKKSPGIPQPTRGNTTDNQLKKIPSAKPSLLKPTGRTTRSSGIMKPKPSSATQRITPPSASVPKRKSQPFKATLTLDKTSKLNEGAPENGRKSMPRPPPTPCTPRGQDKPLLPRKRLLSSVSSCSTRSVSRSSLSELESSVPSTPGGNRRRSFLPTPGKATPARRRSALPTPTKNSPLSAARVTRASSSSSFRSSSSTVIESPPPFKKPAVLREVQSDIFDRDSPNMRTSTPDLKPVKVAKMAAGGKRCSKSPAVGMLVDFSDPPVEPEKDPISKALEFRAESKENLIDF